VVPQGIHRVVPQGIYTRKESIPLYTRRESIPLYTREEEYPIHQGGGVPIHHQGYLSLYPPWVHLCLHHPSWSGPYDEGCGTAGRGRALGSRWKNSLGREASAQRYQQFYERKRGTLRRGPSDLQES